MKRTLLFLFLPFLLFGECIIQDTTTLPLLSPTCAQRKIEKLLLDNGLHVYLVSDPTVKQSAAALCVEAGSWDDPKEHPGMAHFLEHMLFMGSQAYPQENAFHQFICDHGGKQNAYTASDRTVYAFSINHEAFAQAVDRFSHFFIDPLLSRASLDGELLVVDQEHAKNIENDDWRAHMILKETSNPDHPYHAFNTGNAHTLSHIEDPALRAWMETHYSAERMHLTLLSPQPIETLHALASTSFLSVRSHKTLKSCLPQWTTTASQRSHTFFIKPIKERRELCIFWECSTPFSNDISSHAGLLIAALLQSRDQGWWAHWLSEQGLALHVDASWNRLSHSHAFLILSIQLTERGLSQMDTVILSLFQTLALCEKESIPASFFEDVQKGAQLQYQFPSNATPFEEAMQYAEEMPYEELSSFPEKSRIPMHWNPTLLSQLLKELTPDRAIYCVLADPMETGVTPTRVETWMGAEYAIQPVDPKKLMLWKEAQPHPEITFPVPNPFFPHSLDFCSAEECSPHQPLLLSANERGSAYFAQDHAYGVPEASLLFHLKSPALQTRPKEGALLRLYLYALREFLSPTASQATIAGMQFALSADGNAIMGSVQGYSETFPKLSLALFTAFSSCSIDEEKFTLLRDDLVRTLLNQEHDLPVSQAAHALTSLLFKSPTSKEMANALSHISYEEYQSFTRALLEKTYLEATFYGNMTSQQALTLYQELQNALHSSPFPREEHSPKEIALFAHKDTLYLDTERHGSGVVLLLQQGELSTEKKAVQLILNPAIEERFFNTLRTKQQTCYIARAWGIDKEKQLLQFFAVQSNTHSVDDLLARFEHFLDNFDKELPQEISQERFEDIRANVLKLLETPPDNMLGMATELHSLAFTYQNFTWNDALIAQVSTLSYEEFLSKAHTFLAHPHKCLAVLVKGPLPLSEH